MTSALLWKPACVRVPPPPASQSVWRDHFTASSGSARPPCYHTLCISFNPHWSVHFFYTSIMTFFDVPSHSAPPSPALILTPCCSPPSFRSLVPSFFRVRLSFIHNCIMCSVTLLHTSLHPGFCPAPLCAHALSFYLPLYPSVRQKINPQTHRWVFFSRHGCFLQTTTSAPPRDRRLVTLCHKAGRRGAPGATGTEAGAEDRSRATGMLVVEPLGCELS